MATIQELTSQYNALAPTLGRPIRKAFKDKPTAVAALTELYGEVHSLKEQATGRRGYVYPTGAVKPLPKPNSLRGLCHAMLVKGATFEEVMAMVAKCQPAQKKGHVYKTDLRYRTFRLITSMHHDLGYGLDRDAETGKITLTENAGALLPGHPDTGVAHAKH